MDREARKVLVSAALGVAMFFLEQGLQVGGWTNPTLGIALLTVSAGAFWSAGWFLTAHWFLPAGQLSQWLVVSWFVWAMGGGLYAVHSWRTRPVPPVPEFEFFLPLQFYNIEERVQIYGVQSCKKTYRPYHLMLRTTRRSATVRNMRAELYFTGLVTARREISTSGYAGVRIYQAKDAVAPSTLSGEDQLIMKELKVRSNDLRIDAEEVRPESNLTLELVLGYDVEGYSSQPGIVCVRYEYGPQDDATRELTRFILTFDPQTKACTVTGLPKGPRPQIPMMWHFDEPPHPKAGEAITGGTIIPSCD